MLSSWRLSPPCGARLMRTRALRIVFAVVASSASAAAHVADGATLISAGEVPTVGSDSRSPRLKQARSVGR